MWTTCVTPSLFCILVAAHVVSAPSLGQTSHSVCKGYLHIAPRKQTNREKRETPGVTEAGNNVTSHPSTTPGKEDSAYFKILQRNEFLQCFLIEAELKIEESVLKWSISFSVMLCNNVLYLFQKFKYQLTLFIPSGIPAAQVQMFSLREGKLICRGGGEDGFGTAWYPCSHCSECGGDSEQGLRDEIVTICGTNHQRADNATWGSDAKKISGLRFLLVAPLLPWLHLHDDMGRRLGTFEHVLHTKIVVEKSYYFDIFQPTYDYSISQQGDLRSRSFRFLSY